MKRYGRWTLLFVLLLPVVVIINVRAEDGNNPVDPDVVGVRSFLGDIFHTDRTKETSLREGRTFGQKRIQFMLMPMIYKMGVIMTMLTILTVISMKGLMVGVVLLILKLSAIFGKFYSFFSSSHGHSPGGWAAPPQPVHVHVHNSGGGGGGGGGGASFGAHSQAYGGWETAGPSGPPDEHYYYKG